MKRYIRTDTLLNVPSHFNINGLDKLKDFVGTRGEIYDLIGKYNPLAIIDKRQAFVKIDGISYILTIKKAEGGWKLSCIWQMYDGDKGAKGGQYYLQEDRFKSL